jgi:hypothetical protein
MSMAIDLSEVPQLKERRSVLALLKQQEAIGAERYEAIKPLAARIPAAVPSQDWWESEVALSPA